MAAKLLAAVQTYIVESLARFDGPQTVADALKREFGLTVSRQAVEKYNPYRVNGVQKWKVLFDRTRKAFAEDTSDIGISHKSVRLQRLHRMADKAEASGNMVLAAQLMEQAAKEMGDAFTNRRKLDGALVVSTPKSLADFYGGQD